MTHATTIAVRVPAALRDCCAGASELELTLAETCLRGVLEEIGRRYPALLCGICDETGAVRRHVNLFINNQHMRDRDGLDTALAPGDEVIVLPAVSGG